MQQGASTQELLPCPAFHFTRYVNGVEMAEGVCVDQERTLEAAMRRAAQLAPKVPGTVLVVDTRSTSDRNAVLALSAVRTFVRHDDDCHVTHEGDEAPCSCGARVALLAYDAALGALTTTPEPTEPAGVAGLGLEWTEDGYSLRTPFDGDVDGDGRPIVVGGEIVVTFADSDEGDKARERIAATLSRTPPLLEVAKEALNVILQSKIDAFEMQKVAAQALSDIASPQAIKGAEQ